MNALLEREPVSVLEGFSRPLTRPSPTIPRRRTPHSPPTAWVPDGLPDRLPGVVSRTRVDQGWPLESYLYSPRSNSARVGTLVSIHGVTRRAQEQFRYWAPFAARLGLTLVAPCFGREEFPGYQRLSGRAEAPAADAALLRLLDGLRHQGLVGAGPLFLFGYSGGAQFVHRFLLAHPGAADGAAVAAAGWYTFPDRGTPYPYGLATSRRSRTTHLEAFLEKPVLVAVGEEDIDRDRQLRRREWIDAWQGRTRLERAERWTEALRKEARRRGLTSRVSLCRLPGAGHSFAECMRAGLGWEVGMFLASRLPFPGDVEAQT